MLWTILVFIISFFIGFGVSYYGIKDDIKAAKNLEELKIKYDVRGKQLWEVQKENYRGNN